MTEQTDTTEIEVADVLLMMPSTERKIAAHTGIPVTRVRSLLWAMNRQTPRTAYVLRCDPLGKRWGEVRTWAVGDKPNAASIYDSFLRAMPLSTDAIAAAMACSVEVARRRMEMLAADGLCHVSGWKRVGRSMFAVWSAGEGKNVPNHSIEQRTATRRARQEEKRRARKSRIPAPHPLMAMYGMVPRHA